MLPFVAEVDSTQVRRQLCGGSQAAVERMICFGRELQAMSEQLRRERGKNATNKNMLKVHRILIIIIIKDFCIAKSSLGTLQYRREAEQIQYHSIHYRRAHNLKV